MEEKCNCPEDWELGTNLLCPYHHPDRVRRVNEYLTSLPPGDPADDLLPGSITACDPDLGD